MPGAPPMRPVGAAATFLATRLAWHRAAEHVVAKARYLDDGEIRLTAWPGGFATPSLAGGRRVGVRLTSVVVEEHGESRSAPLSTLREAAAFVGVEAGFPSELYPPATPCLPDEPLDVDPAEGEVLAAWYERTAAVLGRFRLELGGSDPTPLILWPEHFDQAFVTEDAAERRRANFGASPGDDGHPEPYLYVGPWGTVPDDPFWDAPHFPGALLGLDALAAAADPDAAALAFLRRGRALLEDQLAS
ncbi:MAG: hypothetical protein GEV08_22720 [Acidimicrobiia bacterium]|nr:hypothetical protein [Acidimicrobiia bacterium]